MALFRKGIKDNAKDFYQGGQFETAQICITKYLAVWFKQVFSEPPYEGLFSVDFNLTLASQAGGYLLGRDMTSLEGINPDVLEDVKKARSYMEKWADDAMEKDDDFCELVVQTLRMHSTFQQFLNDRWPFDDPEGKRVFEIVTKYGDKLPQAPNPDSYSKLIKKWMLWDEKAGDSWK